MGLFPRYNGGAIMERVCGIENMTLAWRRVRSNIEVARRGRSAGLDLVTLRDFEADWPRQMAQLADELHSGNYRPLPPRRAAIPKASGGERAIAILAVRDRIAQRAVQQVLEPIFDPYLLDCSYGCRSRIGVADALRRVERYAEQHLTWVVDVDIEQFFDNVDQRILLSLVRQRVDDVPLLRLIAQWLSVGAYTTPEIAPLHQERSGLHLLRRGGQVLRRALDERESAPLPGLDLPHLASMAGTWEQSVGEGWSTGMPAFGTTPFGGSPYNTLWTAYLLGKPILAAGRRLLPYMQRLGGRRMLMAGTVAAGAAAAWELALRWQTGGGRGTPQGGALSPLLANIYLHPFDVALTSQGLRLVRFMDDMVVMCASEAEAERVRILVEQQLAMLRLRLNSAKSRIVHYDDGLEFLGQALVPRTTGRRLGQGLSSFDEAHQALRKAAKAVRRNRGKRTK